MYGADLSEGVEAMPVAWSNTVDAALPPPILYLRRPVTADARAAADIIRKPPKRCKGDGLHMGAPDGMRIECNHLCEPPQYFRRPTQSGISVRLEVFRVNASVGWGLRCAATHPTSDRSHAHARAAPDRPTPPTHPTTPFCKLTLFQGPILPTHPFFKPFPKKA